jgi:hypothetical protein
MTVSDPNSIAPTTTTDKSERPDEDGDSIRGPTGFDVDLRSIVWIIIRGKWVILACAVLAVLYAGHSMRGFVPLYTAQMVVMSLQSGQTLQLPASVNRFAAGVGIALPNDTSSKFDQFRVLLTSVVLAKRLDKKYDFVHRMFGGAWDEVTGEPVPPDNFAADIDEFFRGFMEIPDWSPPTAENLGSYIGAFFLIEELSITTPIYRIRFRHPDQDFALELLTAVYMEAEAIMREAEIERVSSQLDHISRKLAQISVADYRLSLIQISAELEKRMMVLQANLPYVAEIIDAPVVSSHQTRPNPILKLVIGLIGGMMIGIILVLMYRFLRVVLAR